MKQELEQLLLASLAKLTGSVLTEMPAPSAVVVERTRDSGHGEFTTNLALRLARAARRDPRELAAAIVAALPASPLLSRTEVAGAGFINFHLAPEAYARELASIHALGSAYGESRLGQGERVLLEFVSANPTGPLHVGHGRQAAYGATLANILAAVGFEVAREYYINDAGRQMDILAVSTWLRYLGLCGEELPFPQNGYRGDYVLPLAHKLKALVREQLRRPAASVLAQLPQDAPAGDKEAYIDALIARARELLGAEGFGRVLELSLGEMLADIRNDLGEFGVVFDHWSSERALADSGAIDHALAVLEARGRLQRRDGALWFRASEFGDEKDRVVVRENGQKTYFASDIAYHLQKRERGFARLIDVLGADHHGYVARVRAGLIAMGEPGECLEATLIQFVSLFRGAEKIPMGKREAQFVSLRQLREEVGNDACRFFYLMRSHDQPLDFDLELAKSHSNDNPVYYIQYAHARVASVMKQLAARGLSFDRDAGLAAAAMLDDAHEQAVLSSLTRYPEVLEQAAVNRAPHALAHYLRDLANVFHTYYNAQAFIVGETALRNARLTLVLGVQQVLRNGLTLLGVSAPQSM
ncbi:MAG: arginine--tRNA ligase [Gammaproteobacteria bacterium]|nr:MAG: arginine--tRNA ligase [Gammaproteobacteria bacterium]TLZ00442.1 MAG: arginine--tRNA ligase [Gammaproteobacteria bacterium]TLZ41991.1 MAG: arginine--tRNA ligase [Gammaproteobacteria bacterium]